MIIKFNTISNTNHNGIFINGQRIEQFDQYKYLGVKVDEYLAFSKHAEYLTCKIAKKVNLIDRSLWAKLTIYKTIILPHFNYCSSILSLLTLTEKGILQKKQIRLCAAV